MMAAQTNQSDIHQHALSAEAGKQVAEYIRDILASHAGRVDQAPIDTSSVPLFTAELLRQREILDHETCHLVLDPPDGLSKAKEVAMFAWIIANSLGEPIVQDLHGRRMIEVYDRDGRTVEDGARYHQSRQSYNLHNDCVNDPDLIDYMVLSCGAPAFVGGESIFVDARAVYRYLQQLPEILEVLEQPFWFENRGMAEREALFRMPVVSLGTSGEVQFRYLRGYIEAAHRKAGVPLTPVQIRAFDTLDAILDLTDLQRRVALTRGQTLLTVDSQVLHGRTPFVDRNPPGPIDIETADLAEINRYFLRVWTRRHDAGPGASTSH